MKIRPALFHPATVLTVAAVATILFMLLFINAPRFADGARFILLYDHAPIGLIAAVIV